MNLQGGQRANSCGTPRSANDRAMGTYLAAEEW